MYSMSAPTIQSEAPADFDAVDVLLRLAFGQPDEAVLVRRLRECDAYRANLTLVARVDGRVVGLIMLTRAWVVPDDSTATSREVGVTHDAIPVLALAPMAVLPEYQRRGIGGSLVHHALDAARRAGERLVIVLGHPEYYPRFGFRPASAWGVRCPFDVPDEAYMLLNLATLPLPRLDGVMRYARPFQHH